jgi:tRNA nucleotidyltransferase (CCA-adding enzyme)
LVQRTGRYALGDLFALWRADVLAQGGDRVASGLAAVEGVAARCAAVLTSGAALSTRDLAVDGNDLQTELGIPPSRRLGEILAALLDRVTENPALNTRNELLTIARAMVRFPVDP